MPPRHASQCSQALQRRIAPAHEGIWVTDALLENAWERFYHRSRRQRGRSACNVPGPLESRRRLGKRNLGDLNTLQFGSSMPPWALPLPLDLSKWRWEPPTAPAARANRPAAASWAMPGWLMGLTEPAVGQTEDELVHQRSRRESKGEDTLAESAYKLRALASTAPIAEVAPQVQAFCRQLQTAVYLGELAEIKLDWLFRSVFSDLRDRFGKLAEGQELCITLCYAVLDGAKSSKVLQPAQFHPAFWTRFLCRISELKMDGSMLTLVEKTLQCLPDTSLHVASGGVLPVLLKAFTTWQSQAQVTAEAWTVPHLSHPMHFNKLLRIMMRYGSDKNGTFLTQASKRILKLSKTSPETAHGLRLSWLSILAQMPHVQQHFLLRHIDKLFCDPAAGTRLSTMEAGRLMIQQWSSRGYLRSPDDASRFFESFHDESEPAAMAGLVYAVNQHGYPAFYFAVIKLASLLGRFDQLAHALETNDISPAPLNIFQLLAGSCKDHALVLRFNSLYRNHQRNPSRAYLAPKFWKDHLPAMIADPSVNPGQLGVILTELLRSIGLRPARPKKDPPSSAVVTREEVAYVEDIAQLIAHTEHMSNRWALRYVARCASFLTSNGVPLSPKVLKAFYKLDTDDLRDGMPGRLTRLRVLTRLVKRVQGHEAAVRCSTALDRWRKNIFLLRPAEEKLVDEEPIEEEPVGAGEEGQK